MKVAIQQPHFLPWPGYWHKLLTADRFLLWDAVGFAKGEYINRIRHDGAWLTLPVQASLNEPIRQVKLTQDLRMLRKVLGTVMAVNGKYRSRLDRLIKILREVEPGSSMNLLNITLLQEVMWTLVPKGPELKVVGDVGAGATKTARLLDVLGTHAPEMTVYLTGIGAFEYLDEAAFGGIPIWWQNIAGFDPEQSILTLIAQEPDPYDRVMSMGGWECR